LTCVCRSAAREYFAPVIICVLPTPSKLYVLENGNRIKTYQAGSMLPRCSNLNRLVNELRALVEPDINRSLSNRTCRSTYTYAMLSGAGYLAAPVVRFRPRKLKMWLQMSGSVRTRTQRAQITPHLSDCNKNEIKCRNPR